MVTHDHDIKTPQSSLSDAPQLDKAIATLQANKTRWARLPISQKSTLLKDCLRLLGEHAQEWVDVAVQAKSLDPDSVFPGEEWLGTVWAQAFALREYAGTLDTLAKSQTPQFKKVRKRPDGQTIIDVFPHDFIHSLLLNGVHAEVWMQPEVTPQNLPRHIAQFYQQSNPQGKVTLVLGAGNVNSIPPIDILGKLIHHGEVVICKLNPVNEYIINVMQKTYAPLIDEGYLYITTGGADVGAYLTEHEGVETIHITGSARTHDAIVFGTGEAGQARKARNQPRINKPMTSELGGIGPVIIVPGPWTDADLRHHAESIITMKLGNDGFTCVAAQVLILPENWEGNAKLLKNIRDLMRDVPQRKAYYPGVDKRQQAVIDANPNAETFPDDVPRTLVIDLPADDSANMCFNEEFFGPMLAQTSLPAPSAEAFMERAVAFCNDTLDGTLGANILIHPITMKQLGAKLENYIADLRYGAVAVNGWNALAYLLLQTPWGAFPGHTIDDVQSGIGKVHNTYLLEDSQKAVIYAPFYPMPRSFANGKMTILPRPPWFLTNTQAHRIGRQMAYYTIDRNPLRLAPLFFNAMRG